MSLQPTSTVWACMSCVLLCSATKTEPVCSVMVHDGLSVKPHFSSKSTIELDDHRKHKAYNVPCLHRCQDLVLHGKHNFALLRRATGSHWCRSPASGSTMQVLLELL
jgi:hypothetical protein